MEDSGGLCACIALGLFVGFLILYVIGGFLGMNGKDDEVQA